MESTKTTVQSFAGLTSATELVDIECACTAPDLVVGATTNRPWVHESDPVESSDPFCSTNG